MNKHYLLLGLLLFVLAALQAATGCDLNDPDRDVRRIFPNSTSYRTFYRSIQNSGGRRLLSTIETRLGDSFRGTYETIDNPYTIYEVFRGTERIGYIHGVNQRGRYGGIQIFLALDNNRAISRLYFQRFSSRNSSAYQNSQFTNRFTGLSLRDFENWDVSAATGRGRMASFRPPVQNDPDFAAIMRGIKKNLVLMEYLVYR